MLKSGGDSRNVVQFLRGEPEKEPGLLQNKLILIHIYDA